MLMAYAFAFYLPGDGKGCGFCACPPCASGGCVTNSISADERASVLWCQCSRSCYSRCYRYHSDTQALVGGRSEADASVERRRC